MSTTPTQVRIDAAIKVQAAALFASLGLDMSAAVNLFLHQCVLHQGLPFPVELPRYNQQTLKAMEEAVQLAHDPAVKGYSTMEELKAALEA